MDIIIKVNNQSVGRDKLARLVQYTSRLVWHQLESRNANKYSVDRIKSLENTLSTFRKVLRLGRCVDIFYTALNSIHIEDPFLRFTLTTSKLAHALYLYADHIVWLSKSVKQNAAKIRVKRLELDENLLMYFSKDEFYYCYDPEKKCKTGDIVLIQALPRKLTKLITHEVKEVVYPFGDVTDPITGKKVAKESYREDIDKRAEIYGKLETAFDYEKAPPRGWQDDI
ncbi:unnamed protein product, partial [Iphiclides podalirius]